MMKKVMMIVGISIFVCLSLVSQKSSSTDQDDNLWITYTTTDGLPSNSVAAIAFGPNSELWCVPLIPEAGGGIAHFDSNVWKHYTTEDGLGSDFILWTEHTLAVSPDGVLWAATFGGGVSTFDGDVWTSYTTKNGLYADKVTAVAIAPNGDVWCAHPVPDCGISRFDGESWIVYTPNEIGVTSCNFMNMAFDPDDSLWISGSNVVVQYDGETWTNFSSESGLKIPLALYIDIGSDGRVWILGGSGVSCYDGNSWTHHSADDIGAKEIKEIAPLAVDHENIVWLGLIDEGVFRFDGVNWTKFAPNGAPILNNVFSIVVAPDGSLWFGTENGLSHYKYLYGN